MVIDYRGIEFKNSILADVEVCGWARHEGSTFASESRSLRSCCIENDDAGSEGQESSVALSRCLHVGVDGRGR